jgi:hypothetical protein
VTAGPLVAVIAAAALVATFTPAADAVTFGRDDYTLPGTGADSFGGVAVGDIDNRNGPDIVVPQRTPVQPANTPGVWEFLNKGDGTFASAVPRATGCAGDYYRPLIGQFTPDASADLILNCIGTTDFYLNPGDGTGGFGTGMGIAASTSYVGTIANVDGRQDIVYPAGAQSAWQACLIATADLAAGPNCDDHAGDTFTFPTAFATGDLFAPAVEPHDQVFGLTGPGHDLAVAAYHPGGWSYATRIVGDANAQDVAVGDVNGDGLDDVVLDFLGNPGSIAVFLSQPPTGGLDPNARPTPAGSSIETPDAGVLRLADFDGDGRQDVLVAGKDAAGHPQFAVMLGHGDGTFDPPQRFDTGFDPADTAWWLDIGDVDGDGKPDVIVVNGDERGVHVFRNTTVRPVPGGGGGPIGGGSAGGGGASAPSVSHVSQSAGKWLLGAARAHITRAGRLPVGTTFRFTLAPAARVRFAFTQAARGRRVGGKCVAPTRRNAAKRRCTRTVTAGTLRFAGHEGVNKVAFQGRISARKKLKPGRHALIITARDSAGHVSAPRKLKFTIARRRRPASR